MISKKWLAVVALFGGSLCAQNPVVPPGVFAADPEGHQWKDGRLYLYVSRDESPDFYCSWRYDLLSTDDLKNWTIHRDAFASKGPNDEVPYSDGELYASDAAYKDGKYYLYYSMRDAIDEGVAVADAPAGPFRDGRPIEGISQIDPAVFIDDDGQAYLYWGQFSAKGAKLKDNMLEVDTTTIVDGLVTEQEHFFHEGSSMRKRNGIYYMVYSHLRKGRPTCIGYATSRSPLGPFEYGGVIVDNAGCDPESWNNHGSICEFDGRWYVLYHRTTNGTRSLRKVCIEPIEFNEDGSIDEVEMTSLIAPIIQVCDAISGARPGARREVVESYIKRLKEMEDIALSYPGVMKTYAIQAGRELRVIVGADKLSDQESEGLSHDIAKKIQDEMTYPGQVKITVIRETRAVSYAK